MASAGVPMRRPEACIGGRGSNGTALRLTVMPISCRRSSACAAGQLGSQVAQVDEHEVHVGAAGQHVQARAPPLVGQQLRRQRPRAGDGASLALAEQLAFGDLQRHGLAGDHVLQRAALLAREDGRVDLLGVLLLAEDHPGARPAERLVGRSRDHVCAELDRVGVQAGGDQPGEVGHVDHQQRADLVGDLAKAREVELARIGRPAGEQQLRPALAREAARPRPCRSAPLSRSTS